MRTHDYRQRRKDRVVMATYELGRRLQIIVTGKDIEQGDHIRISYGSEDMTYLITESMEQTPGRFWIEAEFVGGA